MGGFVVVVGVVVVVVVVDELLERGASPVTVSVSSVAVCSFSPVSVREGAGSLLTAMTMVTESRINSADTITVATLFFERKAQAFFIAVPISLKRSNVFRSYVLYYYIT